MPSESAAQERRRRTKALRLILIVAVADFLLLIPLVVGVIVDAHGLAPVIGPIHGLGFLLEVLLAAQGAQKRWWGWWYPIVIFVTTGPPGAVLGHGRAKREALGGLDASPATSAG